MAGGMMMKLWLDDYREVPEGYTGANSVNEAIELIEAAEAAGEEIELLDLDYDLGRYENDGGNGADLLEWLAERETFYPVEIHSTHRYGVMLMERKIAGYWDVY